MSAADDSSDSDSRRGNAEANLRAVEEERLRLMDEAAEISRSVVTPPHPVADIKPGRDRRGFALRARPVGNAKEGV